MPLANCENGNPISRKPVVIGRRFRSIVDVGLDLFNTLGVEVVVSFLLQIAIAASARVAHERCATPWFHRRDGISFILTECRALGVEGMARSELMPEFVDQ